MSFYEPMQMSITSMLSSKKFHLVITSTLSLSQVTKNDTQAFFKVEVLSDHYRKSLLCKVDTGAKRNVISQNTYQSLFPNSACNPGSIHKGFALRLVDMLLVIMTLLYLNWIMVASVNHNHSMLLMMTVHPY